MIVLTRKKNEAIVINDNIIISVIEMRGDKVRLGVIAPKETPIFRQEVYEAIHRVQAHREVLPARWEVCNDPTAMLRYLGDCGAMTGRKAWLFAAAIYRRHWDRLNGVERQAIEGVERLAEGEEWEEVRQGLSPGLLPSAAGTPGMGIYYLLAEARPDPTDYALCFSPLAAMGGVNSATEMSAQAHVLRCLFSPPPIRSPLRPEWLAVGDGIVPKLARGIDEDRAYDRLPILGDALLDAGCDDEALLAHCRSGEPHVRGCWVVDAIRGRA